MTKENHDHFEFFYKITEGLVTIDTACADGDKTLLEKGLFFGFDNISGRDSFFENLKPNLRESVFATGSWCFNRFRQLVVPIASVNNRDLLTDLETLLRDHYKGKRILLLEDFSPFASLLRHYARKYNIELYTSEYFGSDHASGTMINGVLHVDMQKTHFPDDFFDLIMHTDRFMFLADPVQAERETVRILKKGGHAIYTVHVEFHFEQDNIFAEMTEGNIRHLQEPIHCDDPLSPDGKWLVYRRFAFPDMKKRYDQAGAEFHGEYFHSSYLGILGDNGIVFVVRKP